MPFAAAGDKLGPYEVVSLIGKGGMGEVYSAHDSRLGREVAIKVSAERFGERFEREARAVAALNHPNISTLYDVGPNYLVMELVEGPTLAERIREGPIPLTEALLIARQIADALEAAHDKGIVHRDLKPGNIKVKHDGTVKVLDFGLAKTRGVSTPPSEDSPTLASATQAGVILGTAAYMAPEQARGKPIDKRADIWAFGVVLYEMLSGRRLFDGEDITEILASVVKEQPDLTGVPASVRRLLRRCLEKDPKNRLRDISGVELLLEPETQALPSQNKLAWMLVVVLAIGMVVAAGVAWRTNRPVKNSLIDLPIDLGPGAVPGRFTSLAITRDGSRLAFLVESSGGKRQLATRLLAEHAPTLLAGTESADEPFFSPDGRWIGFFADGELKKISVMGGRVVPLCMAQGPRGAVWGEDGYIILTPASTKGVGLSRVLDSGGALEVLTKPEEKGESTHRWPQILPGGKEVLFTGSTITGSYEEATLEILSLETRQWKVVLQGGYFGRLLPSGHLIYVHQGTLFAAPFDLKRLTVGAPVPLPVEDLAINPGVGSAQFDFSQDGKFVYLNAQPRRSATIVWADRSGKIQPLLSTPGGYSSPRISPAGPRLALLKGPIGNESIEIFNWEIGRLTPITFRPRSGERLATQVGPVWAPDGKHLVFTARSSSGYSIQWIRADGPVEAQVLYESKSELGAYSFSPDGKLLAFTQDSAETGMDLWTLPLNLDDPERPTHGEAKPFLHTKSFESEPMFSPDGRWIAYTSASQVYVQSFPGPGGTWPISAGTQPMWSRSTPDLFFLSDNRIMVTTYDPHSDSFQARPRPWSDMTILEPDLERDLAVDPSGKRFAVLRTVDTGQQQNTSVRMTFLLNFFDELQRLVPLDR